MTMQTITKYAITFAVLVLSVQLTAAQSNFATSVADLLKAGNAPELAKKCADNLTLIIDPDEIDDTFSNTQAEQIIKNFFAKNKPSNFSVIHKGTSKTKMEYIIGKLTTTGGTYRVSYYIAKSGDKPFVKELRIEDNDGG